METRGLPTQEWYVGNLVYEATEDEVRRFVETTAGIRLLAIRFQYSDPPANTLFRGYCFVTVLIDRDEADLERLMHALDGVAFEGRGLKVGPSLRERERRERVRSRSDQGRAAGHRPRE